MAQRLDMATKTLKVPLIFENPLLKIPNCYTLDRPQFL